MRTTVATSTAPYRAQTFAQTESTCEREGESELAFPTSTCICNEALPSSKDHFSLTVPWGPDNYLDPGDFLISCHALCQQQLHLIGYLLSHKYFLYRPSMPSVGTPACPPFPVPPQLPLHFRGGAQGASLEG